MGRFKAGKARVFCECIKTHVSAALFYTFHSVHIFSFTSVVLPEMVASAAGNTHLCSIRLDL